MTPDYVTAPDWQNGFSVVYHNNNFFHVDQVSVIKNRFCFHGKMYGKMKSVPSNIVEDLST